MTTDNCQFCGLPYKDHPQCPGCGYTFCDARFQMDHHLCGKPEPLPPKGLTTKPSETVGPETWGPYVRKGDWFVLP
jgi:hypothetical protein